MQQIGTASASDSDSDSSDSEDDAQRRQFLEAADTTLLTNAMFQGTSRSEGSEKPEKIASTNSDLPPVKSERNIEEQEAHVNDLQVTPEMQTHIWTRLSGIIHSQVEFCPPKRHFCEEPKAIPDRVKLVSHADCFLNADILVEGPAGPQRKPNIKRRTPAEEPVEEPCDLKNIAISGETVLQGQELLSWAQRRERPDKVFRYKAQDPKGLKLLALEPSNEFSLRRRQNKWNESKICRKRK